MNCEIHKSDGEVTETLVSDTGFPYSLTHCAICGAVMSKPVSLTVEPERFKRFAKLDALKYLQRLGIPHSVNSTITGGEER